VAKKGFAKNWFNWGKCTVLNVQLLMRNVLCSVTDAVDWGVFDKVHGTNFVYEPPSSC